MAIYIKNPIFEIFSVGSPLPPRPLVWPAFSKGEVREKLCRCLSMSGLYTYRVFTLQKRSAIFL